MKAKDKRDYRRLGTLYDVLRGHVGQPWDDVYAKIRRTFDSRSIPDGNLLRSLEWNVEKNCRMIDGKVYELAHGNGQARPVDGLYVHPETGILCYRERDHSIPAKKPVDLVRLDDHTSYAKLNGIWFRLEFEYHAPDEIFKTYTFANPGQYAALLQKPGDVHHIYYRDVPDKQRVETGRFQCNKKELVWLRFYLETGKLETKERVKETREYIRQHFRQVKAARKTPGRPSEGVRWPIALLSNISGCNVPPIPQRTVF
jgi:hypothetical protein